MVAIKISVVAADGTPRGGWFKDDPGCKNRWIGKTTPGLQQVMACSDFGFGPESWFLLDLVTPRKITGREDNDSLVDEKSLARFQTIPQAMHWFVHQDFGPPPVLVAQVTQFANDWGAYCDSPSAKSMLHALIERNNLDEDDPLFEGRNYEDLRLLLRLGLVHQGHSGAIIYLVDNVTKRLGVDGFTTWMNAQLAKIRSFMPAKPASTGALGFRQVAISLLELCQSIARFRNRYSLEWKAAYPRMLPSHLRLVVAEFESAEEAEGAARHFYKESQADHWYGDAARQVMAARDWPAEKRRALCDALRSQLKDKAAAAAQRLEPASKAMQSAAPELPEAMMKVRQDWLADHTPGLRRLLADYAREFDQFRPAIPGLVDLAELHLGRFGTDSASACEVLLRLAQSIEEWPEVADFHGIDPDRLRVAIEKEIAHVVRQEADHLHPSGGSAHHRRLIQAPPPPESPTIPPPQRVSIAEAIAGRPDLNLPRTPKTTLVRWIKAPQSASDLGVNPEGKVNAQMPLVAGLLRLHAQKESRRRPPQMRSD